MSAATHTADRPFGWTPGFRANFPDSSSSNARPFSLGTVLFPMESADDLMEALGLYSRERADIRDFLDIGDDRVAINSTLKLVERDGSAERAMSITTPSRAELDEAQSIVRAFENLNDGWDEPGSYAPPRQIVEDALVVLQNWQPSGYIPEPEASVDGKIVLEIYDDEGFTLGGIELVGGHRAVYSVNRRTDVLDTGSFDTTSQSEIIRALARFKALWDRVPIREP